jgi:hypothetical protein
MADGIKFEEVAIQRDRLTPRELELWRHIQTDKPLVVAEST